MSPARADEGMGDTVQNPQTNGLFIHKHRVFWGLDFLHTLCASRLSDASDFAI